MNRNNYNYNFNCFLDVLFLLIELISFKFINKIKDINNFIKTIFALFKFQFIQLKK